MKRVTRTKKVGTYQVIVEREALGQVADYSVFRVKDDERTFLGSGSKREAQRIFDKEGGET